MTVETLSSESLSRPLALRKRMGWRQWQMAAFLGLSQPAVAALEKGQAETGPVSRLLDQLAAALDAGSIPVGASPEWTVSALMPGGEAAQ